MKTIKQSRLISIIIIFTLLSTVASFCLGNIVLASADEGGILSSKEQSINNHDYLENNEHQCCSHELRQSVQYDRLTPFSFKMINSTVSAFPDRLFEAKQDNGFINHAIYYSLSPPLSSHIRSIFKRE